MTWISIDFCARCHSFSFAQPDSGTLDGSLCKIWKRTQLSGRCHFSTKKKKKNWVREQLNAITCLFFFMGAGEIYEFWLRLINCHPDLWAATTTSTSYLCTFSGVYTDLIVSSYLPSPLNSIQANQNLIFFLKPPSRSSWMNINSVIIGVIRNLLQLLQHYNSQWMLARILNLRHSVTSTSCSSREI